MWASLILCVCGLQPPGTTMPQPPTPPVSPPVIPAMPATPGQPAKPIPSFPTTISGKTLPEWIKELNESKDGAVRELAVKTLPHFGPTAREASLKPLIRIVREDSDPGVRVNAILTLGTIGANNKDEAKQIIEALKIAINTGSLGGVIRLYSIRSIANYGIYAEQANDAIPTLVNITKDPSWEIRKSIAYALGQIGGPTKPKADVKPVALGQRLPDVDPKTGPNPAAMKALLAMLSDPSATVRLEVIESLTLLGPPAVNPDQYSTIVTPYMTAIAERTKAEKDHSILIWLQMLTMRLDGNQFNDTTMMKIIEHAKAGDADTQIQALSALSILGEKSLVVGLPFAREMLRHQEPVMKLAASQYIGTLGTIAKQALPDLEEIKKDAKDEILKKSLEQSIEILSGKKPVPMPPK
jgi:HEAT repeat protein